ncbi:hypothetical protein [Gaetbulibacter sp. PBL-D1]|uniref:hypothetical protein n=1 Tax=Gaetbulibacter sp. PBL-D1 TaxID=3422594 RepID=UPI003D2EC7CD
MKNWSTSTKIILGIVVILIGLYVANLMRPDIAKKFFQRFKNDLELQEQVSKKKYDSIEAIRQTDYLKYVDEINYKDQEIEAIYQQLKYYKTKTQQYEKELNDYRSGNFDERFRKFSNLVRKDSI